MNARISRPLSVLSLGAALAFATAGATTGNAHELGEAHHGAEFEKMRLYIHELAEHADERIAALKTELKITDAQLPQWNDFAAAVHMAAQSERQESAKSAGKKPKPIYGGETAYPDSGAIKKIAASAPVAASDSADADPSGSLIERFEEHAKQMSDRLAKLKTIKEALDPLYASFSDEQKKIADGLRVGPLGVL